MSIRTTNFDALAAAAPLDRQASTIRDGSGDLWEAKISETTKRWIAPPPLKPLASLSPPGRAFAREMVGQRFGRMVVLGVLDDGGERKQASWVCRCDCGYYETKKAKSLRSPQESKCSACIGLEQLQTLDRARSTTETRKRDEALLDRIAAGDRP